MACTITDVKHVTCILYYWGRYYDVIEQFVDIWWYTTLEQLIKN